jgi:hypothetical protein
MQRSRVSGYTACAAALALGALFLFYAFLNVTQFEIVSLESLGGTAYFAITIPIALVALLICGTGLWVGWTILTIKVAPPMPEIVEKNDFARFKALVLCLIVLAVAAAFVYGLSVRSYWALAIPAAAITLVVLGMVFWVGVAIITARATLPESKKK